MNWLSIILLLLKVVDAILQGRSDKEQQQIGEDRVVKQTLLNIAKRTGVAKDISDASKSWDRAAIDDILRDDFRD